MQACRRDDEAPAPRTDCALTAGPQSPVRSLTGTPMPVPPPILGTLSKNANLQSMERHCFVASFVPANSAASSDKCPFDRIQGQPALDYSCQIYDSPLVVSSSRRATMPRVRPEAIATLKDRTPHVRRSTEHGLAGCRCSGYRRRTAHYCCQL